MFSFKFHQNPTTTNKYFFEEGRGGGEGGGRGKDSREGTPN